MKNKELRLVSSLGKTWIRHILRRITQLRNGYLESSQKRVLSGISDEGIMRGLKDIPKTDGIGKSLYMKEECPKRTEKRSG